MASDILRSKSHSHNVYEDWTKNFGLIINWYVQSNVTSKNYGKSIARPW